MSRISIYIIFIGGLRSGTRTIQITFIIFTLESAITSREVTLKMRRDFGYLFNIMKINIAVNNKNKRY